MTKHQAGGFPFWWVTELWGNYNALAIAAFLHLHATDERGWVICSVATISQACDDMRADHVRAALKKLTAHGLLERGPRAPGADGANSYRLNYDQPPASLLTVGA
ncbi:MAG: hypothetical protein NVS2B17_31120 [Candidatus Velthaea sp.]